MARYVSLTALILSACQGATAPAESEARRLPSQAEQLIHEVKAVGVVQERRGGELPIDSKTEFCIIEPKFLGDTQKTLFDGSSSENNLLHEVYRFYSEKDWGLEVNGRVRAVMEVPSRKCDLQANPVFLQFLHDGDATTSYRVGLVAWNSTGSWAAAVSRDALHLNQRAKTLYAFEGPPPPPAVQLRSSAKADRADLTSAFRQFLDGARQ